MTEEDRAMAKRENGSLSRFLLGFALACVYGVIGFFAVWEARDALRFLLITLLPGVRSGQPSQLYDYLSILVCGVAWLVTFLLLWFAMCKEKTSLRHKLIVLAIFCLSAAALYALSRIGVNLLV